MAGKYALCVLKYAFSTLFLSKCTVELHGTEWNCMELCRAVSYKFYIFFRKYTF